MQERSISLSGFPAATCETCGTTVLTHIAFDEAGEASRRCINCDGLVTSSLAWLSTSELEAKGYEITAPKTARVGGCGGQCGCSTQRH